MHLWPIHIWKLKYFVNSFLHYGSVRMEYKYMWSGFATYLWGLNLDWTILTEGKCFDFHHIPDCTSKSIFLLSYKPKRLSLKVFAASNWGKNISSKSNLQWPDCKKVKSLQVQTGLPAYKCKFTFFLSKVYLILIKLHIIYKLSLKTVL